jgi:hypothetical protein
MAGLEELRPNHELRQEGITVHASIVRAETNVVHLCSGRDVSPSYVCNAMNVHHWRAFHAPCNQTEARVRIAELQSSQLDRT